MKNNTLLLRTCLFVPGHIKKLIEKASECDADALVFDLEDSCKPNSNKKLARRLIKDYVSNGSYKKFNVFVRINPRESGFLFDDVTNLSIEGIDGFLYPMAKSKEDIIFFSNLLTEIELSKGYEVGKFKIFPVIETSGGILNSREICAASKRVVALGFGSEDFTTDLQSIRDIKGKSIFTPRALIAFAARSEGVIPIDTPYINLDDSDGLEKHCNDARILGFGGMQIIHPKEIETVHKVYTPNQKEIQNAKEIIKLSKEAEKENRGVVVMNEKFIGPPLVKRAKKLIDYASLIESRASNKPKKNS